MLNQDSILGAHFLFSSKQFVLPVLEKELQIIEAIYSVFIQFSITSIAISRGLAKISSKLNNSLEHNLSFRSANLS